MTLIPDFSGVRSDNQVLNLSPFEVRFDEQRQFFIEGVELFNRAGLFYSRRIGGTSGHISGEIHDNEEVIVRPRTAQLLNAFKLTGRTSKGLGIGFFNAITDQTMVTVQNSETGEVREVSGEPITDYNILVLDQNLKNNSSVTLTNAMVLRGNTADDANISAMNFRLNDGSLMWRTDGLFSYSNVISYEGDDAERNLTSGYKYRVSFSKARGNFQFNVNRNVETDDYEINDIGFLRRANRVEHQGNVSYNSFTPKGIFNNWSVRLRGEYNELFEPRVYTNTNFSFNIRGQFRNFWSTGFDFRSTPRQTYDYFEPRVAGYFFIRPEEQSYSVDYRTDSRKDFRTDGRIRISNRPEWNNLNRSISHSERLRIGQRFEISHRVNYNFRSNERGYVTRLFDDNNELTDIIIGQRDVKNLENTINFSYIFSNRMGLTFRTRHYWSRVKYNDYFKLQEDGYLTDSDYAGLEDDNTPKHDRNFNAFNIDMDYNWQFKPGSEIRVIWKRQIGTDDNNSELGFVDNLSNVMGAPNFDTITIRMVYFIDYLNIKKLFKKS